MNSYYRSNRVLIVGVNGQDGSLLAEQFVLYNWKVYGLGRQRLLSAYLNIEEVEYIQCDLTNTKRFYQVLLELDVKLIIYTAALHGPAGTYYEEKWQEAHLVNTLGLHACLEYSRLSSDKVQVVYFSSAKVFDLSDGVTVTERSKRSSNCIYSATKNCATDLVQYYRHKFKVPSSVVWLFNHESARRSIDYFIPKIVWTLKNAISDKKFASEVHTLDFWCDWGDAAEFMELLTLSVNDVQGKDFILATGNTIWARDLVSELFESYGLDYSRHIMQIQPPAARGMPSWHASPAYFEEITGRRPVIGALEMCQRIISIEG